jgi:hypothetical protein
MRKSCAKRYDRDGVGTMELINKVIVLEWNQGNVGVRKVFGRVNSYARRYLLGVHSFSVHCREIPSLVTVHLPPTKSYQFNEIEILHITGHIDVG